MNLSSERCIIFIKQPLHLLAGECALCQIMYSLAGLFWRNNLGFASVIPSEQTASSYIILYRKPMQLSSLEMHYATDFFHTVFTWKSDCSDQKGIFVKSPISSAVVINCQTPTASLKSIDQLRITPQKLFSSPPDQSTWMSTYFLIQKWSGRVFWHVTSRQYAIGLFFSFFEGTWPTLNHYSRLANQSTWWCFTSSAKLYASDSEVLTYSTASKGS